MAEGFDVLFGDFLGVRLEGFLVRSEVLDAGWRQPKEVGVACAFVDVLRHRTVLS